MDILSTKRAIMFAWLTKEELEWLLLLSEFDSRKEEFEIESISEGLNKLLMTEERMEQRDNALLGLKEEGLIKMDAEQLEYLDITGLVITQRGKKIIKEAKNILNEADSELSSDDKKTIAMVRDMEKATERKGDFKEKAIGYFMEFAVAAAKVVFEKVLSGK